MMKMRARYVALAAAGFLSSLGCSATGSAIDENGVLSEAVNVPAAVANGEPSGVVESTGNLYWTRNTMTGTFPYRWVGRVYRAAKTSVPGQETVLYSETGSAIGSSFGNITFANDGGVWYGYFLATYYRSGTYVKRVPLDGSSPAITFGDAPSLASPGSPIVSDGMYLFFYGPNGLYAAPLDGGRTITVAATAGITGIGFDRAHLFFSAGNVVHWAFKPNYGNASGVVYTMSEPVAAIGVSAGADNDDSKTTITVGTTNRVYLLSYATGHVTELADGLRFGTSPHVTSVSSVGTRALWTCCDANNSCWANNMDTATQDFNHFQGLLVQTGAREIMGDATQMFFIDDYALERLAY